LGVANIGVMGTGYVGLTTAVCFSELGHKVVGFDVDTKKVEMLTSGTSTIYEEGMSELIVKNLRIKNLVFTNSISHLSDCDFVFLCVPTPQDSEGSADLSYVIKAAKDLNRILKKNAILVTKSTVPVNAWKDIVKALDRKDVTIVSNPEFLREGTAINDFFHPDRIVVGSKNLDKAQEDANLYQQEKVATIVTDTSSAELIKYASNSFLAIKLTFVNEIAALCEAVGANANEVLQGMGQDSRIGSKYLQPGPGWGGSCFPKDVRALRVTAENNSINMALLSAALDSNEKTFRRIADKVESELGNSLIGKNICVWGLAFKAGTDDLRDSPSVAVIERLIGRGATVVAFDPVIKSANVKSLKVVKSIEESYEAADAILLLTEWEEFNQIEPESIKGRLKSLILIDTRNILDRKTWIKSGFKYIGNGW
jgi:UDPglucose 6-dehydrogenase